MSVFELWDGVVTVDGETGEAEFPSVAEALLAHLSVTASSGTAETLDVKLQHSPDGVSGWVDITNGDFAQATGATEETITVTGPTWPSVRAVLNIGGTPTNETQTVTITGTPNGGDFTLTFGADETDPIAYNANAQAVEDALVALSSIGADNVNVTGGPGPGTPFSVEFIGDLAGTDVALMVADGTGLTGGTNPDVAVAQATAGAPLTFTARIICAAQL